MNHVINDQNGDTYYDRNKRWLIPLLAGLTLVLAPGALRVFAPEMVPTWLPSFASGVASVAMFMAGIGAAMTPTTSGRIFRVLAFAVVIALTAWLLSQAPKKSLGSVQPMTGQLPRFGA